MTEYKLLEIEGVDHEISRLEQEMEDLLDYLCDNPPPAGDATFVEFSREAQQKYDIGRLGRLTRDGGTMTLHSGPIHREPFKEYVFDSRNFMDIADQYAAGQEIVMPIERVMAIPHPPVPKEPLSYITTDNIEPRIFDLLSSKIFVLLNPSWSTLMRADLYRCDVCFTADVASAPWVGEMIDYVEKLLHRRQALCTPSQIGDRVVYLGTNRPEKIPPYVHRYVALIPDPFTISQNFQEYSADRRDDHIEMSYKKVNKRGRMLWQKSFLFENPGVPVYPPCALQAWTGKDVTYFMETTEDFGDIPHGKDSVIPCPPRYINLKAEEKAKWEIMGVEHRYEWRIQGKEIIDVKAKGNYFSRRRIPPPEGYKWTPFCTGGTCAVTYYTTKLAKNAFQGPNQTVERKHMGLDVVITPYSRDPVLFIWDSHQVDQNVVLECSDEPLFPSTELVYTPSRYALLKPPSTSFSSRRKTYFSKEHNLYWDETHIKSKAFLFKEMNSHSSSTMITETGPRGEYHYVKNIKVGSITYLIVPPISGAWFFFPTIEDYISRFALSPLSLSRWSEKGFYRPIDSKATYQGRFSVMDVDRLRDILVDQKPMKWQDEVLTLDAVAQRMPQGESSHTIFHLLRRTRDFVGWRPGKNISEAQWVLRRNLQFKVGGPENFTLSDLRIMDILNRIDEVRSAKFFFDPRSVEHAKLIAYLRENSYRLTIVLCTEKHHFKVSRLT